MEQVRLQKFLAECGVASRRAAEELILEGKVTVNGAVVVQLGTKIDPLRDRVAVRKKIVRPVEKGVLLLYKPRGVVCTLNDPEGRRSVADFLSKHYRSYYPVGRLDWDSTGLIVLTNDGELAERLMHPRYQFPRVYKVKVEGRVSENTAAKIERGVQLKDGLARGKVLALSVEENTSWIEISVKEGRNRLVRRIMDKVHHPVIKLVRLSHGPFKLGKLKPGELRRLTMKDYDLYRRKVFNFDPEAKSERERTYKTSDDRSR